MMVIALAGACGGGGNGPSAGGSGGQVGTGGGSGGEALKPDASMRTADAAKATGGSPGADAAGGADGAGSAVPGRDAGPDLAGDAAPLMAGDQVVWNIDNLQMIGGHKTTVLGAPMVIDTPAGKAV